MFVAIEGIDGSGKTTCAENLFSMLNNGSNSPFLLRKKGFQVPNTYAGGMLSGLNEILWEKGSTEDRASISNGTWFGLLSAWFRLVDQEIVKPHSNAIVICDSWIEKIIARFSLKGDIAPALLDDLRNTVSQPDLTIFLDVGPEHAAKRKSEFGQAESGTLDGYGPPSHDSFVAYQTTVRGAYVDLLSAPNCVVISCRSLSPEAVAAAALSEVLKALQAGSEKVAAE